MKLFTKVFIACALLASLVPVSFAAEGKDIGHVFLASNDVAAKPADAVKAVVKDIVLKGDAKCTACHDEADSPQLLAIGKTRHGVTADGNAPTCTSCHGDSVAHTGHKGSEKPPKPDHVFGKNTATPAAERNQACLSCHSKDSTRHLWAGSAHEARDVACTSCHQIHTAHDKVREKRTQPEVCFTCHKEQRAETHKISTHPLKAEKLACSGCHNLHGSAGPKLLKKNTVNETCWTCHADKRGPFLFEHQPVVEDCTNCHTPHGSNITPMLKTRPPFMCQECHDGSHASGTPVGPNAAGIQAGLVAATGPSKNNVGNACMNCHSMVHGSNSPAGAYFQR